MFDSRPKCAYGDHPVCSVCGYCGFWNTPCEGCKDESGKEESVTLVHDELPMLNSATKEAYEAGYQAAKEKYERYAALWKRGARVGYWLTNVLVKELEGEKTRSERYRRRAFAMRRALTALRNLTAGWYSLE